MKSALWGIGLVLFMAIAPLTPWQSASHSVSIEVDFCQLPVSEVHRQGRTSFSLVYAFDLRDRRITDIREVTNPAAIPANAVSACLEGWRFDGLPGTSTEMVAEFRWTHGVGWEYLKINGAGLEQMLRITGNRCAYEQ